MFVLRPARNILFRVTEALQKHLIGSWIVIICLFTALNLVATIGLFRKSFSDGDISTFYQFARLITNNEVIYKDFIHFRTPGSYFLQSIFLRIFGQEPSSISLALQFESHVLFVAVFAIAMVILLRFKYRIIGFITLLTVTFLPSYLQLRTAIAFLAISLYIRSRLAAKNRARWLLGSGIATGLTFCFGQEAFVMVLFTVIVGELMSFKSSEVNQRLRTGLLYLVGLLCGVLPLLIYVIINGSFGTFIYYTIYYAFILQPKGMDLAYPILSYETIIYFIVPLLVLLGFTTFTISKRANFGMLVFIAFIVARLVTLFGRTDEGHLIFVLPEIILLALLTLQASQDVQLSLLKKPRVLGTVLMFAIGILLAMYVSNIGLVLCGMSIIFGYRTSQDRHVVRDTNRNQYLFVVMVSLVTILFFILYPVLHGQFKSYTFSHPKTYSIGGVSLSPELYDTITKTTSAVNVLHPKTILSYPIQPYYYTLAPHHATRFITFEPQTTAKEQALAIKDIQATKPEVVVFDPAQAVDLSSSLARLNRYILTHYTVHSVITGQRILWVMVPGQGTDKPVFSLYELNPKTVNAYSIQSPEKNIVDALEIDPGQGVIFNAPAGMRSNLKFDVVTSEMKDACVDVRLLTDKASSETNSCGASLIPLDSRTTQYTFLNNSQYPIILNQLQVTKGEG